MAAYYEHTRAPVIPDCPPRQPPTWADTFALLHELWGDAKIGAPYDRRAKRTWARLLEALEQHADRAGYARDTGTPRG
jgi:hypothetical protein